MFGLHISLRRGPLRRFLLVLALTASSVPFTRAAAQTFTLEPASPIVESVRTRRPLGAPDRRFGVMAVDQTDYRAGDYVFVRVPRSFSGTICLELNSVDDIYVAAAKYALRPGHPAQVRLHLGSKHLELLRRYAPEQIGILSWRGESCTTRSGAFFLSSWSAAADVRRVVVLVASGAPQTVIAGIVSQAPPQPCTELPRADRRKYDFRCEAVVTGEQFTTQLQIRRRDRSQRLSDINVGIELP